ncbi:MAG: amidase [Dehalococcoidia bacterium]|nr:amidase [Dehalococcoidia bacterium]
MTKDQLPFAPASEVRRLLDSREVSSVELTEMFLGRIESLNPGLNAYLTVTPEEALAAASRADQASARGESLGPLHGVPVSIKDLELTAGIRTTMGSLVFRDYVPEQDSLVVERVKAAGAVILGKTNTPEFGFSGTTENRLGDAARNPWDPERTPGGSSGGAGAAVAAGLCTMATGSDGGGSIRIPCSFSGIYGIKPGQGRVPRAGGVGRPGYNTFSQSGPMTRTVRDSALLLQVLAGPDARDPGCVKAQPPDFSEGLEDGLPGLRIAWSPDLGYAPVDGEVAAATAAAARVFEELGCSVDEPEVAVEDPFPAFWDLFAIGGFTGYGHLLEDHAADLTHYVLEAIEHGSTRSVGDYSLALLRVQQLQAQMEDLFQAYDLLLTPTMAVPAFPVGEHPAVIGGRPVEPFFGYTPFTFPFNMTMHAAASAPCGFSSDGMPIGLQIVGRREEEATVLRASAAFERARPWRERLPPIS